LEGKLQNAFKATYPPGDAREDWVIFKDLAKMMKRPLKFNDAKQLNDIIKKHLKSQNTEYTNPVLTKITFVNANILIEEIDYYYTNPIARSSKVMSECRQIKKKYLFTGIEKAS
jgi:NADH-quinone oxidoreductase subunit G